MYKNFFKKIAIIFTLVLIILFSSNLSSLAVDIGGELEIKSNFNFKDEITSIPPLSEFLTLKLNIPESNNTKAVVEYNISRSQDQRNASFKKLYLKKGFEKFNLTLGKQPVSWGFGSLINPVDFNFGAEVMTQSTSAKYIEGAKVYIPINWKSGVEVVAKPNYEFNNNHYTLEETKFGLRARTMFKDYDLSLNLINEPNNEGIKRNRIGLSVKGDLGPLGAYSALSYEKYEDLDKSDEIYLFGLDYSRAINYDQRIYLQGEILNISAEKLGEIMSVLRPIEINSIESNRQNINSEINNNRYNMFLGNINYSLNQFSSFNFMLLGDIENESITIMPQYNNQLPGNIDMSISSNLSFNDFTSFSDNLPMSLSINLKYPF
ncbi:MAG: hypothetical protein ACQEQF_01325 [Bacillota bacterium]